MFHKIRQINFLITIIITFGSLSMCTNLDTLQVAQVIFRHGARNIDKTYPTDPYADESYWPGGYHQLTCIGKVQGYNLGRYLRNRYDGFVNNSYSHKELHVQSSDVDRNVETAYAVLAGFYPPNEPLEENHENCQFIEYKSVPVHTAPQKLDSILRQGAPCPRYTWLLNDFYMHSEVMKQLVESNQDLLVYFAGNTGIHINTTADFSDYYDALVTENYYNMTLPEWTKPFYGTYEANFLGKFYFKSLVYTEDLKRLRTGPLLQRVLDNFNTSMNATVPFVKDLKLYMMSGHDHTLTSILYTLGIYPEPEVIRPTFASAVILELHRVSLDDESLGLEIQLYFRNETDDEAIQLEIPNCGNPCLYDKFIQLTEPYRPADWNKECLLTPGYHTTITDGIVWGVVAVSIIVVVVILLLFVCRVIQSNNTNKYSPI